MVLTVRLKLYPPNKEKAELLRKSALSQSACINFFLDKMREKRLGLKELHNQFYREARNKFDSSADLVGSAEMMCLGLISKKKEIPTLHQKLLIIKGLNIKIENNNLGITFGKGRIWIPFHSQEISKGKFLESKLKEVDGSWYCFLSIEVKEKKQKPYKKCIGVDLGIAKVAAIATPDGKNTRFFRGEPLRAKRVHYSEMRKKLRPKLKHGNVYKLLKRIDKKESNWIRNENHRISKEIVKLAKRLKVGIGLENLRGITERINLNKKTRRMIHAWSFRQLADFISYKARLDGIPYVTVDPRGTSKGCSQCGYTSRSNRKSQSRFKCNKCGYETNADRNGAINIALRATSLLA